MPPKCILINPWVYDFAAANLWSRPLGLLKVAEFMSQFDLDLRFIDCMDVYNIKAGLQHIKRYGTGNYPRQVVNKPYSLYCVPRHFARYGISPDKFKEEFRRHLPCSFVLVTSLMSYWYPGVQKAVTIVKELSPDSPVILGGIYATLNHNHALQKTGADFVYRGHIDMKFTSVMKNFGFNLKRKFPPRPYYSLGLYNNSPFAPILTAQGCPDRCSYCASSMLFDGFVQRNPFEVVQEILELYGMGIRDYAFYDDALLMNADSHLKVILKEVIRSNLRVRFHCPNGIHARFIDDELPSLMMKTGFKTLRLGLETISGRRQKETGGKVNHDIVKSAVERLKKGGFTKDKIGVYLMYGLPGQGLQEVIKGVDFLKDMGVKIHLTEFSPIPGTPCWEELVKSGIIDNDMDPLLTNNTVFTLLYSGYDLEALKILKHEVKEYNNRA
jgi:radical SAM superfamily enzyme YgiQ (UPF0313 family)